jgi:hypothetical protein
MPPIATGLELEQKGLTLGKDVHRIIHLDIHVITYSGQFVLLGTDETSFLTLDFPRG